MTTITDATILIVDDSPENLHVLGELLRPHYRVLASEEEFAALSAAGFNGATGLGVKLANPPTGV